MITKEQCLKAARDFRSRSGVEASDENTVAAIHLMNANGLDLSGALDQSSRGPNDHGIDAWFYSPSKFELFIYQSKLTDSKSLAAKGLSDLDRAAGWIEEVIVTGQVEAVPNKNPALFNLYTTLSKHRDSIRRIHFVLLTYLDAGEVEDLEEFDRLERKIGRSRLGSTVVDRGGKVRLHVEPYDLERATPTRPKTYSVERIPRTRIDLRPSSHLDLAYVSLHSLVELYRMRGEALFDKNVRLSLFANREAKDRLVNPMDETLEAISKGRLSPSLFAFYHIGVTLSASSSDVEGETVINLEAPSILNGCQTIVIATEFLRKLEKQNAVEAIERFKQIKVIAKVVVGTTSDELKEITNANNRQNPIENWQLFSNEPVHIEVETALKEIGVFYERQKGRFDSTMKSADNAKYYVNTNGTFARVVDLAQLVALSRRNTQWAAKPSEVFANRETHDRCFDKYAMRNPRDIVFGWNVYKALKRGLNKYLDLPAHVNSNAPAIFRKPIIRAHVYSLGLLHYYQSDKRRAARAEYSRALHKKANPTLVEETQNVFYQKVLARVKNWYVAESKNLTAEISTKRTDVFFSGLATELGVDEAGLLPFTERSIDWEEYRD